MEAIIQSFIHAFGWSILHSLWQGAIIYAILFVVLLAIPKLSPATKHNLSYVAIGVIFTWFMITFVQQWTYTPESPDLLYYQPVSPVTIQSVNGFDLSFLEKLFPAITLFYFAGFLLNSFILFKGYMVTKKFRNTGLQDVPGEWQNILFKTIAHLNIRKNVTFHLSAIAKVPMAIGYLKPVILFPISLCTSLDSDQVEAILIHELTHIKRNDYLLNQIKAIIDIILFFNPFVWFIGRFIKTEREHVCDDMVLKYTCRPINYAETLLKLETLKTTSFSAQAMTITGQKNYLLDRIKRITDMKTNAMNLKQQLAGITMIIFAICCIAWLSPSKAAKNNDEKSTTISGVSYSGIPSSKISLPGFIATDTIIEPKKKSSVKIIITDPEGNQKEYNSIKGIPDSVKEGIGIFPGDFSFIADSFKLYGKDLGNLLSTTFNSPEFLKQQRAIAKQFSSPEFKKSQQEIAKQFSSPEFKKAQKEITEQFSSPEFKKQMKEISKNFNSPEFQKKQQELLEKQKDFLEKLNSPEFKMKQEETLKKLNSTEFKERQKQLLEKQKELLEQINSPEFKKQQEELIEKQEELMKKMNSPEFEENQSEFPAEINLKLLKDQKANSIERSSYSKSENHPQVFLEWLDFSMSADTILINQADKKYRIFIKPRPKVNRDTQLENNRKAENRNAILNGKS